MHSDGRSQAVANRPIADRGCVWKTEVDSLSCALLGGRGLEVDGPPCQVEYHYIYTSLLECLAPLLQHVLHDGWRVGSCSLAPWAGEDMFAIRLPAKPQHQIDTLASCPVRSFLFPRE